MVRRTLKTFKIETSLTRVDQVDWVPTSDAGSRVHQSVVGAGSASTAHMPRQGNVDRSIETRRSEDRRLVPVLPLTIRTR